MSVSGLAITLSRDEPLAAAAIASLRARPDIEVGPRSGVRLAATVDATTAGADRTTFAWIADLPGVERVDVVAVWFDDEAPLPAASQEVKS